MVTSEFQAVPIIDISALVHEPALQEDAARTAEQIRAACRDVGFFYVVNHGVDPAVVSQLDSLAREFFALPQEEKMRIPMSHGGRAWRGYFPCGGELTSGKPDMKEGLYFGTELSHDHPLVASGTPLHGANLFPKRPAELQQAVLSYMASLTGLGHTLMRGIAISLGLPPTFFRDNYMQDPLCLFRIFGYPPDKLSGLNGERRWGVGEHSDYGLLTILYQDDCGGLQVKNRDNVWVEAPPVPGSFVINIGDMLEVMSAGLYRSTPHRVANSSSHYRVSMPFFFDPDWTARCEALPLEPELTTALRREDCGASGRWDGALLHEFQGTYGQYVLSKVSKVFPDLAKQEDVQQST